MRRGWILLILLVWFLTKATAGTTYTWAGGSSGSWTTSANWSPSTGYPGKSGSTTDVALVNSSSITITLNSTLTISQLQSTSYGVAGIVVNFSGSPTLTISGGLSIAQPVSASTGITFSGSGTALIGGTSAFSYLASMAISSGTTVTFSSGATLDFTSNQGTLTNAGILNFSSGSTFQLGSSTTLSNSGTVKLSSATLNLSGSPSAITNTGAFSATLSTIALTGSSIPITNSGSGVFTTTKCTVTSNNSGCSITNSSTFIDHGSTYTLTGQSNTFTNSGASSVFQGRGITFTFSSANNGHTISNAGFFTADSASVINLNTFNSKISNTGTVYAGTSNSPCIINLGGQGANISNTGTFYVGSTSGITISGYQAAISTGSSAFFIFQSDQYGSAYLGALPPTSVGLITGTYYIQRYLTGGSSAYRGYRMLSSPVYATTVSSNNVYSLNYVKASALITGSGGTAGGFDKAGNPSLYLYRENIAFSNATFISGNFRGVANIASAPAYTMDTDGGSSNIPVGNGFLFWFRGDRTSNLANKYKPGTVAESVTMTAAGTLNQGPVTVHDWYTPSSANLGYTTTAGNTAVRGDNLVGNPYPSSIDWETFQTTTSTSGIYGSNVGNTIYILNPLTQNYGAYIKGGGGLGTNSATNVIASGQGFFVIAGAAGAQLTFNESAKTTAQNTGVNLFMGKPANDIVNDQYIKLQIGKDTASMDDILIRFNSAAKLTYADNEDAPYKPGFGKASISSLSGDSVNLSINALPLPKSSQKIALNVSASVDTTYQLRMRSISQVPRLFDIWLLDNYKNDSVNMRNSPAYSFAINKSDSASFGSKRFALVVGQNPEYAYKLLDFAASKVSGARQVLISWKTANEQNYTHFTAERSTDNGKTYEILDGVSASGIGSYAFIDKSPADNNLYRLKSEDINKTITYSNIVPIAYSTKSNNLVQSNISLYPNPAKSVININIGAVVGSAASYSIMITSSSGLLVRQTTSTQANWQGNVSDLMPGTYIVKVFRNQGQAAIGSGKFVKI